MTLLQAFLDGAKDALLRHGAKEDDIDIARVPGSFEIPLIAKKKKKETSAKRQYNAVIMQNWARRIRGATPLLIMLRAEVSKGIATAWIEQG